MKDRDFFIVSALASGMPPKRIAFELGISRRRLGVIFARLLHEHRCSNNVQLVFKLTTEKVLPPMADLKVYWQMPFEGITLEEKDLEVFHG